MQITDSLSEPTQHITALEAARQQQVFIILTALNQFSANIMLAADDMTREERHRVIGRLTKLTKLLLMAEQGEKVLV